MESSNGVNSMTHEIVEEEKEREKENVTLSYIITYATTLLLLSLLFQIILDVFTHIRLTKITFINGTREQRNMHYHQQCTDSRRGINDLVKLLWSNVEEFISFRRSFLKYRLVSLL